MKKTTRADFDFDEYMERVAELLILGEEIIRDIKDGTLIVRPDLEDRAEMKRARRTNEAGDAQATH